MFSPDIPFVPSSWERLKTMTELAEVQPNQKTADLGSGDGRIVVAMAKLGAEAVGFEVDAGRVALATQKIQEEGLAQKAKIYHQSFWEVDLSQYDIITVYGVTSIMEKLEKKLEEEAKTGCRIITNYFPFPNWQPKTKIGEVYLYIKDESN